MNIVHIAPISFKKSSGLSVVIPKIVSEQNKLSGVNACLINTNKVDEKKLRDSKLNFQYYPKKYIYPFTLTNLDAPYKSPDIVILHSTYIPEYKKIVKELKRENIPYIIVPHGSMTDAAQNRSKIKKKFANMFFLNDIVNNSLAVQYLSEGEALNTNNWNKNYIVIGNGIELPGTINKFNNKSHISNINFLGRLDIKHKGLDFLLEACLLAKDTLIKNKVVVNLYGPEQNGSAKEIIDYIDEHDLESIIKVKGPIYGEEKHEMYENTDIFILTSRHEGLPTTVLEALSYGIPCLLTPGTNLAGEVVEFKCGWKTSTNPREIANNIRFILEEFSEYKKYGQNAKEFIKQEYSWKYISEKAVNEYKKLISYS